MAAPRIALPRDEVHLHYVREDEVTEPALIAAYLGLLNAEERGRRDRFYFERSKHEFLITRALVRTTLSRYEDVPPAAWTFSANAHGCPAVSGPRGLDLRFNLTNTKGLVAIAVARDRELGVDVEDTKREGETVGIADRFFSPSEVAELQTRPVEGRRARFFDYWTLKEAYIKARGMGLSIPLDHFSFQLHEGRPIAIAFAPELPDDPASWQFEQRRPTASHLISLAIRRRGEPDLRVEVRRVVPLLPLAEVVEG